MGINDFKSITKDDILGALGLETKHSTGDHLVSGLLMMGIGLAVGVGIGMLLAPKSGSELREDLSNQYRKTVGMAQEAMSRETPSTSTTSSARSYGSNPV